jgi:hypothetical protein
MPTSERIGHREGGGADLIHCHTPFVALWAWVSGAVIGMGGRAVRPRPPSILWLRWWSGSILI